MLPIVDCSMCVPAVPKRSGATLDQRTPTWQVVSELLTAHCPLMSCSLTFCSQLSSAVRSMSNVCQSSSGCAFPSGITLPDVGIFSLTSSSSPPALEYCSYGSLWWPLHAFLFTFCLDLCFLFLLWLSKAILTMYSFLPLITSLTYQISCYSFLFFNDSRP